VATFEQEFVPAGMTMGDRAVGTVWLSWPDRALFQTGEPAVQMMGLSGRTVRLVDITDETCDERTLTDREWERIPLAALLDPRGASLHFKVMESGQGGVLLEPREPGGVDRVEIEIGAAGLPNSVQVVDPQGAVNRLAFGAWQPATGPPGGLWLPEAPPGVECLAEPGPLE
jgi:hypothetical protein